MEIQEEKPELEMAPAPSGLLPHSAASGAIFFQASPSPPPPHPDITATISSRISPRPRSQRPPLPLAIRHLTYGYAGLSRPVLETLSLEIPAGQRVALLGEVASGKSTLAHLTARLLAPPPGAIFLGNRDITTLPASELKDQIGLVPQETFLFSQSLRENLSLGLFPPPDDDALHAVLERVEISEEIKQLPSGIDTILGEKGVNLSGGQRQRIALARMLLRRLPFLILDDCLSAVDAHKEQEILGRLFESRESGTLLFITHRSSIASQLDRIIILAEGKIAEDGTPPALRKTGRRFNAFMRKESLAAALTD